MIELQIDNLAIGGRGVGRADGKAVFVPYTLPAETVRCRVRREKKNYCEAELVDIITRSPERIEPPCPVFTECGGCQWQHISYDRQLSWKESLFREAISRAVAVDESLFKPIVPSLEPWHYRCRAQLKCRQTENGFVSGFYRSGSHYVVDIESCPLLAPQLNNLFSKIKTLIAGYPLAHRIPQLDLSVDDGGRLQLIVHFLEQDHRTLAELLQPLADELHCAVFVQKGRKDSISQLFAGDELFIEPQDHLQLRFPPGGFTQVNLRQNRNLVADVLDAVPDRSSVIDLYCGIGNFSVPLAEQAAQVAGVEDYAPAIHAARINAARAGCDSARFIADDAVAGLNRLWHDGCDVVVLDPPRTGAYDVVKRLVALQPARIVYVSCDPMTLARDLKVLINNGYQAVQLRPYDMFPQTSHIEGLVVMERMPG